MDPHMMVSPMKLPPNVSLPSPLPKTSIVKLGSASYGNWHTGRSFTQGEAKLEEEKLTVTKRKCVGRDLWKGLNIYLDH